MNNIIHIEGPQQSGRSLIAMLATFRYRGGSTLWICPTQQAARDRCQSLAQMAEDNEAIGEVTWPWEITVGRQSLNHGLVVLDDWSLFTRHARDEIFVRFSRQPSAPDKHRTMLVIR